MPLPRGRRRPEGGAPEDPGPALERNLDGVGVPGPRVRGIWLGGAALVKVRTRRRRSIARATSQPEVRIDIEGVSMVSLLSLWLPILLSAVIVFVASSVIHMTPLWHKSDFPHVPREAELLNALRPFALPPGDYFIPRAAGMQEMRSPEFKEKMKQGPVALLTVMPNGPISMGRPLTQWFVFLIVVGIFVAYVASRTLPVGTPYMHVFQIV